MTSCSASSASAFPEAPSSQSVAIAATRSITPAPVRPWPGSGPRDAKTASRFSIGPGRSDGPLLGPSAHHSTPRRGPPLHRARGYLLGVVLTLPSIKKAESRAQTELFLFHSWINIDRLERACQGMSYAAIKVWNSDPRVRSHRHVGHRDLGRTRSRISTAT